MRFLKELLKPKLKCKRVGHVRNVKEVREGYVTDTKGFRCVADDVVQSRPFCSRCKAPLGEWKDEYRSGLNGLTLPRDDMKKLEMEGALWRSKRTERIS